MARFVADGQTPTSFGTACGKYAATVFGTHALTETVFVFATAIARLIGSFHFYTFNFRAAKLCIFSGKNKTLREYVLYSVKKGFFGFGARRLKGGVFSHLFHQGHVVFG